MRRHSGCQLVSAHYASKSTSQQPDLCIAIHDSRCLKNANIRLLRRRRQATIEPLIGNVTLVSVIVLSLPRLSHSAVDLMTTAQSTKPAMMHTSGAINQLKTIIDKRVGFKQGSMFSMW